jgi:hypothetical protein
VRHSAIRGLNSSGNTESHGTATSPHQSGSSSAHHHDAPVQQSPQAEKASRKVPPDGSFLSSVLPAPHSRPNSVIFFTPPALPQLTRAQSFVSYLFLLSHTANLISSPQCLPIILGRQTPTWREHWMRVCHLSLPCCM